MSSKGVNKVILVGNLGKEPETRFTTAGKAVTNAVLATSEHWKDKATGEPQELTEWHRLVFFDRLGEIAGEYLKKGSKVYIEGSIRTRKWQDNTGQDRYTSEIVVKELQMLDKKPNENPSKAPNPAPTHRQAQPAPSESNTDNNALDDFEDIPF